MNNIYNRIAVQTAAPEEFSQKVFGSILIYLQEYKDTSRSKAYRKIALESAFQITDWVISVIEHHTDTFERELVHFGFTKIFKTITEALSDFDKVYDVNDSIGFLKILSKR